MRELETTSSRTDAASVGALTNATSAKPDTATAAASAATQRMINEPQPTPPAVPLSPGGGAMLAKSTIVQFPNDPLTNTDEETGQDKPGMLTATTLKSTTLPVGTYVEVDARAKLDGSSPVLCAVKSGFDKTVGIPYRNLRAQPRIAQSDGFTNPSTRAIPARFGMVSRRRVTFAKAV